jgi:crotonobetainyl-CoA:carnitine CoA-transferase CaiB-like acyl-CoA transferase
MAAPLDGLVVLDLTGNVASAYTSLLFADLGAEVIMVEPPGGSMVRKMTAAPFYLRGKKSIVLDLREPVDLAVCRDLAGGSDVVIEAFGPGAADRLGLSYDELRRPNPGLVYTSISGFGHQGPFAHLKAYEAVVMAKTGSMYGNTVPHRSGQPVMPVPYGASTDRYPDAFVAVAAPSHDRPAPTTWVNFGLLNGYSKDGRWMQFAHATPRQFDDFLRVLGLSSLLDTPEWKDAPSHPDYEVRDNWWAMMLEAAYSRTIEEWQSVFDSESNVFAEIYRHGLELLEHPQIVHDNHAVTVDDPDRGPVRQMGPLIKLSNTPADVLRPMPRLDADAAELRARRAVPRQVGDAEPTVGEPPLAGVTVLDLGTFYAGPFGSTMLADQGARVIKVEPLTGDPIRFQMPMPESSGVRVTQGKESIAIDAFSPEGRQILTALARKADVILHCYRGGVAERMGLDFESVVKHNPTVMYHHGVGYGIDGPYCRRPAFAPTIAAGSGFSARSGGGGVEGLALTVDEIKRASLQLAGVQSGHPDGFAALAVGVALSLDIYLRDLGCGGQTSLTSMLSTMGHVIGDAMIDFAGAPPPVTTDPDQYGFHALYRLYEAADDSWIVLCAPTERAWEKLLTAVPTDSRLTDPEFATPESRQVNDATLVEVLGTIFSRKRALEWERTLSAAGVGCAAVAPATGALGVGMFDPGGVAEQMGWLTPVAHPLFGEHSRTTELVRLSRSGSCLGPGEQIGGHTRSILRELGYDDATIDELRAAGIIEWP